MDILSPRILTNTSSTRYYSDGVKAGFPSPANDFTETSLDLNEYLVEHPASTFFVRVVGDSMTGSDIHEGDILVVDRSLEARNGDTIIACLDGEFTVKKFVRDKFYVYLIPTNVNYRRLKITKDRDFQVWGIVTYVISNLKCQNSKRKATI